MSDIPKVNSVLPIQLVRQVQNDDLVQRAAVVRAIQYLNRTDFAAERQENYLAHSIDSASGRSVVKVLDRRTKEVMYQIPSEEVLKMAADVRRRRLSTNCGSSEDCDSAGTEAYR